MGYRPPQYQRGLKLYSNSTQTSYDDIDHPNIKGD